MTRRLSKYFSFSRTESRNLGALSKLDDFLLNPQVRTCSVAVPGTIRNSNSENREPTGARSLDDPCPETRFSSHHSGNLNSSEVEEYSLSHLSLLLRFRRNLYIFHKLICHILFMFLGASFFKKNIHFV